MRKLRFGEDGYFWINDFTPTMVVHPIKPALDGTSFTSVQRPNGKFYLTKWWTLRPKMARAWCIICGKSQGFNKPQAKISFVEAFKPWGWIIGTGVYADDIDALVAKEAKIRRCSLGFGASQ